MFFLIFLAVAVKKVFILIFTTPDGLLVAFTNSGLSSRFSLLHKMDFTAKIGGFFRSIINPEGENQNTNASTQETR